MSDLEDLSRTLNDAADRAVDETEKVVSKGCLNIKQGVQKRWKDLKTLPRISRTVGYDITTGRDSVLGVVGPDTRRRRDGGALGGFLEYGSVHNPPHPALNPELTLETPKFEQALADMGARLLDGDES